MRKLSIGSRLTLSYLAIFAVGQFIFGAGMWLVLRHHLIGLVDDGLQAEMEDFRFFLDSQKPNASAEKFQEEVYETYSQEHAGDYLSVVTTSGDPIFVSRFLTKNGAATATQAWTYPCMSASFHDELIRGIRLRFLRSCIQTHALTFGVDMGTSTKTMWQTLDAFRTYLLYLAPLMLLSSAAGGYWLSRRALAPVELLTNTACTITGQNLSSRLEKLNTGDELQRLSDTLNEMLDRIESAFQHVVQFTADASHELRTPLSLMRAEAEVTLRKSRDVETYRVGLQNILRETERMSVLIEDLLALARADSGREFLNFQPLDLRAWLPGSVRDWSHFAQNRGAVFTVRLPQPRPIWVLADEFALRRVLSILIDNAFKYAGSPAQIEVTLDEQDQRATLSVLDNGIGIPPEEHQNIFERFYRVDRARSSASGGAGLGLAIARWIVERHKGSINVASAVDLGARFSFDLPVVP